VRKFLLIGIFLSFAALPFELPVAEALHGILWPWIGDGYLLFLCGAWIIAISICFILSRTLRVGPGWQQFIFYGGIYISLGLLAVLSTAFAIPQNLQLSLQQFIFGYAAPVVLCFTLFHMNDEERRLTWLAFYSGWCVFLLGSLVFLFISWRSAVGDGSAFGDLSIGQKLFAWRYTFGQPWNLYSIYMGNANKESNYLIIFLLFSASFMGNRTQHAGTATRRIYIAFWTLAVFTLLILFSRAALFLLPIVVYASGFWKTLHASIKWAIAAVVGLTATIGYASYSAVLAYLFTATYLDDASGGALGTFSERFQQWRELGSYLVQHQSKLLFGLGTGGYGLHFFNLAERGTHNMFLDTLAECGVVGFAVLVLLILWLFLNSLDFFRGKNPHAIAFVGTACLVGLMFREHSVSYLYVTSLGGLCFTTLFYSLALSRKNSPAKMEV